MFGCNVCTGSQGQVLPNPSRRRFGLSPMGRGTRVDGAGGRDRYANTQEPEGRAYSDASDHVVRHPEGRCHKCGRPFAAGDAWRGVQLCHEPADPPQLLGLRWTKCALPRRWRTSGGRDAGRRRFHASQHGKCGTHRDREGCSFGALWIECRRWRDQYHHQGTNKTLDA